MVKHKHKVEVHVPKNDAVHSGEVFAKSLLRHGIIAIVTVDVRIKKRRYPYITVDNSIICTRRLIKLCRDGGCKWWNKYFLI